MDGKDPLTRERWYKLANVERYFVIYKALKWNVFKTSDIEGLLLKERLNFFGTYTLPLAFLPAGYFASKTLFPTYFNRILCRRHALGRGALVGLPFYLLWQQLSPFKKSLDNERERLLGELEKKVGGTFMGWVELVPYSYTEYEAIRRMRTLVRQRDSIFAGKLWAQEDTKVPDVGPAIHAPKPYGKAFI